MKTGFLLTLSFMLVCTLAQAQINSKAVEPNEVQPEGSTKAEVKKNVVKLYSRKEKGTVIVTSHRPQEVQLYVFDVEGTILFQCALKKNEKKKIDNLAKGTYTYTIFANDVSVEEGQLVIK